MGVDTDELKVSSNYTISEYVSCHRTVTFAGNGNFYEKPEAKAQRECLHEITVSRFCQVHNMQKMPTPAKPASFLISDMRVK
jgi:phage head maturation protease